MSETAGAVGLEIEGPIATITIDNPAKRNSVDVAMLDALVAALRGAGGDPAVHAVVLRGAGEQAFCAGADFDALTAGGDITARFSEMEASMERVDEAFADTAVPVIAALRGACLGGGVQLAIAADFRLASDDLKFGVPAVALGIVYPLSAIEEMVRVAGPAAVKALLIEGAPIGAEAALAKGFVDEVVAAADFEDRLAALVGRVVAHPPAAIRATKGIIGNAARGAPRSASVALRDAANRAGDLEQRLAEIARRRSL